MSLSLVLGALLFSFLLFVGYKAEASQPKKRKVNRLAVFRGRYKLLKILALALLAWLVIGARLSRMERSLDGKATGGTSWAERVMDWIR